MFSMWSRRLQSAGSVPRKFCEGSILQAAIHKVSHAIPMLHCRPRAATQEAYMVVRRPSVQVNPDHLHRSRLDPHDFAVGDSGCVSLKPSIKSLSAAPQGLSGKPFRHRKRYSTGRRCPGSEPQITTSQLPVAADGSRGGGGVGCGVGDSSLPVNTGRRMHKRHQYAQQAAYSQSVWPALEKATLQHEPFWELYPSRAFSVGNHLGQL